MGYHSATYGQFLKIEYLPYIREQNPTEYPTLSGTLMKWTHDILDLKMEQINMSDVMKILKDAEEHVAFGTVKKIKGYISRSFTYAMTKGFMISFVQNPFSPKWADQRSTTPETR
ncbi:MAG: hypothetical protein HOC09_33860 [Deltaproteobacteria bacterium]|nr:hypothetical protein [Deltaproteobacteria bacterium]